MSSIFITVETAAPILDMTTQAIWRSIREGTFPFPIVRIGRQIRIDARALGLGIDPTSTPTNDKAQAREVLEGPQSCAD